MFRKPNSSSNSSGPKCEECGLNHNEAWECAEKLVLRKAAENEAEATRRYIKRRKLMQDIADAAKRDDSMRRLDAALEIQKRNERL